MEIIVDERFRQELLEKIAMREFSERSGVHQSDLVYCLNRSALRKLIPYEPTTSEVLVYSIGWSTQRWLTGEDEDEPSIEIDGIIVTPDAMWKGAPWELKATYASNQKDLAENMHWLRQMMAQCKVTNTFEARLSRFSIMGNWKWVYRPTKAESIAAAVEKYGENWADHPTLEAWHIKFTEQDIAENWVWLKVRREYYLDILERGQLLHPSLALPLGQEWECEYCRKEYKELCNEGKQVGGSSKVCS